MRVGWRKRRRSADATDVLKGAAAGLVAGIAGAWAMNQFHAAVSAASSSPDDASQRGGMQEPGDAQAAEKGEQQGGEPSTVLAAEAVSRGLFDHELTEREQRIAGPLMHYGFGAVTGAAYGAAVEAWPALRAGGGTAYGVAVWLTADELAVPGLGLSEPPTQHPLSTHLSGLGAHLVFGAVVESVRGTVRALL